MVLHQELPMVKKNDRKGLQVIGPEVWESEWLQDQLAFLRRSRGLACFPVGPALKAIVESTWRAKYVRPISAFFGWVYMMTGQEPSLEDFANGWCVMGWLYTQAGRGTGYEDMAKHVQCAAAVTQYLMGLYDLPAPVYGGMERNLVQLRHWSAMYGKGKGSKELLMSWMPGHHDNAVCGEKRKAPEQDLPWDRVPQNERDEVLPLLADIRSRPVGWTWAEGVLGAGSLAYQCNGMPIWFELYGTYAELYKKGLPVLALKLSLEVVDWLCMRALEAVKKVPERGQISEAAMEMLRLACHMVCMLGYMPAVRNGSMLEVRVGDKAVLGKKSNSISVQGSEIHIHLPHSKRTAALLESEQAKKVKKLGAKLHTSFIIPIESLGGMVLALYLGLCWGQYQGSKFLLSKLGLPCGSNNAYSSTLNASWHRALGAHSGWSLRKRQAAKALVPASHVGVRHLYGSLTRLLVKERKWGKRADMMGTGHRNLEVRYFNYRRSEEAMEFVTMWVESGFV